MASISANGSKGHHKFTLTVTETSTSVSNNTSTISFRFQIDPIKIPSSAENAWDWDKFTNPSNTISYKVVINGTTYSGTIPSYNGMGTLTLKSGTQVVTHNADGTKTLSFSFSVTDATAVNYTSGNASANGTLALTPLATEKPSTGAAPIINPYVEDINDKTIKLTGDSSTLIRYHSSADATMNVTLQGGATSIKKYTIKNGSRTESQSTYTFRNVESNTFTFSAEDNKGYVGTKTYTANMVDYIRLTCNVANGAPDANGDMYLSCGGDYFNDSFGAKHNSLTVLYYYSGSDGSSDSGYMDISISGNTYKASVWLEGLNYQTTYTFTITAKDELEEVEGTKTAVKTKPLFHWSNRDFAFEVPVDFKGGITGSTISSGTWTPSLSAGTPPTAISADYKLTDDNGVDQGCRMGWYQKLGNVVTIGWQIKAEVVNSAYNNYTLKISGIPFKPSVSAFGGGVAFGIYIPNAKYVFECWCVSYDETAKTTIITARTQPVKDAPGNLSVASTSYYPEGGGIVTLAGTICYTV